MDDDERRDPRERVACGFTTRLSPLNSRRTQVFAKCSQKCRPSIKRFLDPGRLVLIMSYKLTRNIIRWISENSLVGAISSLFNLKLDDERRREKYSSFGSEKLSSIFSKFRYPILTYPPFEKKTKRIYIPSIEYGSIFQTLLDRFHNIWIAWMRRKLGNFGTFRVLVTMVIFKTRQTMKNCGEGRLWDIRGNSDPRIPNKPMI